MAGVASQIIGYVKGVGIVAKHIAQDALGKEITQQTREFAAAGQIGADDPPEASVE